jgi:X-Pro dipeptidyl-peptidase (S15 family)
MNTLPGLAACTVDRVFQRLRKLPAARNEYVVERGLATPTRDGGVLVSDHYARVVSDTDSGTILIRTPYGRGLPVDILYARTFAARGYHVILQSCRGTQDSTGIFEPMVREAEDGQDTIVWLRDQPWFTGALGTMGMSTPPNPKCTNGAVLLQGRCDASQEHLRLDGRAPGTTTPRSSRASRSATGPDSPESRFRGSAVRRRCPACGPRSSRWPAAQPVDLGAAGARSKATWTSSAVLAPGWQ